MKNYIFIVLAVVFVSIPTFFLYQDTLAPTASGPRYENYSTRSAERAPAQVDRQSGSSLNIGTILNYAGGISAIIQIGIWGYGLVRRRA